MPSTTSIAYVYDADARPVKQTVGSNVTNYLWDAASPSGDVVYETNGSGATLASYVLGGTGLISQTRGSTTSYFLQDRQGSTRALTNSSGTVTDTYSYDAFGDLYSSTGTTVNPYRYTGQQFDTATGLYDLRARYYAPALGRFLSQDIYPFDLGNPVELNRYGYTTNDPINTVDPSGHDALGEYGLINQNSEEEGAAAEPAGEAFASEGEALADEIDVLLENAGYPGEETINALRTAQAERAAFQLVSEGLDSPNADALINELARLATFNSDSDIVSLGRVPFYLDKGIQEGYTYFNLPGSSYQILHSAGEEFLEAVNEQFMYNQMELGKDFGFSLGGGGLGPGSQLEYNILNTNINYLKIAKEGFEFFFKFIAR